MKISSLFASGGVALLGLIFGVILTFELIRFGVVPGGKALQEHSKEASPRLHDFGRIQERVVEHKGGKAPPPASPLNKETVTPVKSGLMVSGGYSSTSSAEYPEFYGLSNLNVNAASHTGLQSSQKQLRGTVNSVRTLSNNALVGESNSHEQFHTDNGGNEGCKYDFKVYVYELPPHLASVRYAEEARKKRSLHVCQKCILEQFSLEYILVDFFTQFCGRTYNPEEADFFYLPIIRDAEYRVTLDPSNEEMKGKNRRAPSPTEEALLEIMGDRKPRKRGSSDASDSTLWLRYFNVTDRWWNRYGGMDHIIAMPAPVTNLRHEGSMRGHFHYMSHLHTPIFLGVEYSRSFVLDYPTCATRKNIVVPYPTTDPKLFNGQLHSDPVERHSLLYYAGGMHGECVGIRRAIRQVMMNGTLIKSSHITPRYRSNQQEREHGMRSATFCPIPVGDSPSSKRMYDVLHFGCVPVILSDELVYAYSNFTGGPLDDLQFSIRLPQSIIQFPTDYLLKKFGSPKARKLFGYLPDGTSLWRLLEESAKLPAYEEGIYINPLVHILRMVSQKNLKILKTNIAKVEHYYRYYKMDKNMREIPTRNNKLPDGGAIEMVARLLSKRKREGIIEIGKACQEERFRPNHQYKGRFPCDRDNANSLMGAMN